MDMNFKQQAHRKFKRVEKLMNSGLLVGYAQKVKVSFEFLDIENNGWFALKDLTERGSQVSSYLGLGLDLSSTFAIMDAFRSFDVGIRGRVRLEDFGVSLIIRMLSFENAFYNNLSHEVFGVGINSVSKFLRSIKSSKKSDGNKHSRTSISKIFSAVPFSTVDDDEDENAQTVFPIPESFKTAMSTIYYLLEDVLVDYSGSIETDVSLTVDDIEKILRDTFLLACRELKIQLQLSQAYIEKIWCDKGHELNEDTRTVSIPWDSSEHRHRKVNLEMSWKPPRKTEFGTRVQFEMTDVNSLKSQLRRSGSILATSGSTPRKGSDNTTFDSILRSREGNKAENDGSAGEGLNLSLSDMYLEDQPHLDTSQLYTLQTAIKNIDRFFALMRNPNPSLKNKLSDDEKATSSKRFTIQGSKDSKSTFDQASLARTKELLSEACLDPVVKKQLESELSLELMESQDHLRSAHARLEILEIIQMEICDNAKKALDELSKSEKENCDESQSDNDDETEVTGMDDEIINPTVGEKSMRDLAIPKEVSFDEIMNSVQEVRALVSQRGSENMIVGSLFANPSAIVPLQNVEDNKSTKKKAKFAKECVEDGFGEEKSQTRPRGILSKVSNCVENTCKPQSNKKIQVAALIQLMNASINSISEEMSTRSKQKDDFEKMQLLARNNEEKAAEAVIASEQWLRQENSASAIAVEVQVLRDRVQHVSAMEAEIDNLKEKNLYLNRQVKDLERMMSERKERWNSDSLLADEDDVDGSSKTLIDLENKVLTLKEENNELRGENAKLKKEQHQHIMASKNAEKRLKLCLQDNLGLNQKVNRLEEDYNNSKIEVSDLLGQIEHQRDTEQERLQVAKKLHTTGLLVTELRGKLLEAKAEALHANKLRDELAIAEARVAKLMEAASEAEITSDSNQSAKQEVEELNIALREKMRENRELSITVRSLERKVNEGKTVQARLDACQDEVNRYKIKVEQCAPMLAEVARLRGAARAAVRSLQEQDKTIINAEDTNKKLRKKLEETTLALKRMEKIESKLIESESECSRLSDIVLTEIPQLKEELTNVKNEKAHIETQYRHIKKSTRQSAVSGTSMKDLSSGSANNSTSSSIAPNKQSSSQSPSLATRRQSVKSSATQNSPVSSKKSPSVGAPPPKKQPPVSPGPPPKKKVPPPPSKKKEDVNDEGASSMAKNKEALQAKFKPPVAPPPPQQSKDEKNSPPPPPPPPSATSSSSPSSTLPSVDQGGSMAENKAALLSLFKPRS